MQILPTRYIPQCADDFIGDARHIAREFERIVAESLANGCPPLKIMLNGEPGIGKSALVNYLIKLLGSHPQWSNIKYNATQVKMEAADELAKLLPYRDMYSLYRVIQIEEADKIPTLAQVRFLTLMDDLTRGNAIICTSNCHEKDFEERFQTRFMLFEVDAPEIHELANFLGRWVKDKVRALEIAKGNHGNVRAALFDAERAMLLAA